jgi:hypothetical protein
VQALWFAQAFASTFALNVPAWEDVPATQAVQYEAVLPDLPVLPKPAGQLAEAPSFPTGPHTWFANAEPAVMTPSALQSAKAAHDVVVCISRLLFPVPRYLPAAHAVHFEAVEPDLAV